MTTLRRCTRRLTQRDGYAWEVRDRRDVLIATGYAGSRLRAWREGRRTLRALRAIR